ncbi:DUF362 domain-containing protein [uncultured Muribaculum sp.]|uniref:DUF362 domain-containing protein n=1 Tax=uncultured Muribaculum sp. TaxID=1918613 RepID=UPI0025EA3B20|nr:DUF362 domain-containing protein [uncultured Muribaculum sp.]
MEKKNPSTVYFCPRINAENLVKVYKALNREAKGRVAVKLSTGEAGNPNHLSTDVIKKLVHLVDGTIVECNTAYDGRRNNTPDHLQTAAEHGFTAITEVDIMDAAGDMALPVRNGRHLKENFVGKNWRNYDFTMVLSHFKGHPMAGFGGALKNVAIGMASSEGKAWIHTAGRSKTVPVDWENVPPQEDFLESMAEACESVFDKAGENILFINVANNLSVDCDCVAEPEPIHMEDIGILASLDPVALDRACVDMVYNSPDPGKSHLIERMESRDATHLLDYAEQLGLGSQTYVIETIDPE